jgi:hypothetical protein
MRKKIAVIAVLATVAISLGSMHPHLLHAEQHAASEIPGGYTIISGGNVTATYNFSSNAGVDRWAYRHQTSSQPPDTNDTPDMAFNASQYARIAADEDTRQIDRATAWFSHAAHRFVFTIAQNKSTITLLHVSWNGGGVHTGSTDGAILYLWNHTAGAYDQLDSTTLDTEVTLEETLSAGANYIDTAGNLTALVVQQRRTFLFWYSYIATDYIEIAVTHTGGT